MQPPRHPRDEAARLEALRAQRILDTPPDEGFDDLAGMAAEMCGTPIALISFIDERRQWIKANRGMPGTPIDRDRSFCGHTILEAGMFVVPDASADERFADNPLVTADPHIRFYAGAPLLTPEGHALGTLCVMDRAPHELSDSQRDALQILSRHVMAQLALRRQRLQAADPESAARRLAAIVEWSEDAIIGKDLNGIVTDWNGGAERLFEYTAAEIIGTPIRRIIPSDRRDEEAIILSKIRSGESVEHFETVRQTKSGRLVDVSVMASPIKDAVGTVIGASKVARDITHRKREREALREREEQLRLYAEHSPVAVAMFDRDMRYLVASRSWLEDFQLGRESIVGRSHYDIFPDLPPRWRLVHERCLAGAIEKCDEDAFPRADGRTDWIRWEVRPWRLADGTIGGLIIFSENITDRKHAQEAVRKSEERYRALFDYAPDGILIADRDSYQLDANHSICAMLGYTRDELLGKHASDLLEPTESLNIGPARDAILARAEYRRQWTFRRKDGSTFSSDVIATALPDGNILAMIRDVTERDQAAEALRVAEERMRFALDNAKIGIWDMDFATGTLRWSETLEAQYGLEPGTFDGRFESFIGFIHPTDRASMVELIQQATVTGGDFTVQHRARRPDGGVRWLTGAGRILLGSDNTPVRAVGISIDVTDRRTLEAQYQQAQKMEAIGRLAGGVAHDFNNLLTIILGYSQLLLRRLPAGDPGRADVTEIQRAGASAAALTRQLLAFSRKEIIEPAVLNLNRILGDMREMLQRLIGEDIQVIFKLRPDLEPVKADRGQIEQVVMNLTVNARDAMPGGGAVTIETANVELDSNYATGRLAVQPGRYVVLTVSDTGSGMTADIQSHLFEPFFTTKERGKGTGLGLATVHGIVTQSGGNVNVYTEVGKGSSFKVYLPVVQSKQASPEPSPVERPDLGSLSILVVEDADALRELARRLLVELGHTAIVAANADEAIRLFGSHDRIDLLLTDVVMPGMSGPDLVKRLREDRPALKVVYMSGYTEDAIVQRGVLTPGVVFLHKPFTTETLDTKLRTAMAG